MKQTQLFTKTRKEAPSDEVSIKKWLGFMPFCHLE